MSKRKETLPIHTLDSNSGKNTDFFILPLKLSSQVQEQFHVNPEQGKDFGSLSMQQGRWQFESRLQIYKPTRSKFQTPAELEVNDKKCKGNRKNHFRDLSELKDRM